MSDDLLIKINADASSISNTFDDVKSQTEDLEGSLKGIATVSGVAFAALAAQVGVALSAFAQSEAATRNLTQAMQDQGIFTVELRDQYASYAEEVSKTTGLSETQITAAQAVAQSFLGQVPVTEELTQAIADLSVKQGVSLPEAAAELGKAIATGTTRLASQGLQFSATDTEAQRYTKTIAFVTATAGGFAAAADQGLGSLTGLKTAFEKSAESLGAEFAPAATLVIKLLTEFFTPSKDAGDSMNELKAALIAVGLGLTGMVTALSLTTVGLLAARAAAAAFGEALTLTGVGAIVVGIGLLIVAITELALHWKQVSGAVIAAVGDMGKFISATFDGIGTIINGAMNLSVDQIKAGVAKIGQAFSGLGTAAATGWQSANVASTKGQETQLAGAKSFADKRTALQRQNDADRAALRTAEISATMLQEQGSSAALLALEKQYVDTLKQIVASKDESEKAALRSHLDTLSQMVVAQYEQDSQRKASFNKLDTATEKRLDQQGIAYNKNIDKQKLAQVQSSIKTEQDIQQDAYLQELQTQINAENQFLADRNKYGAAYAVINQAIHTEEVQGFQKGASELQGMTQSSNATLKAIGKAASISNIVIKSAESAMNIYAGFSSIPFIGQALGIAGAAAAIAFGAEQVGQVTAAASGGVVGGSGFGDTQPFMLEPGELITPKQNFNEVVNSVAASRSGQSQSSSGSAQIQLSFKGNFMDMIEAKIVQRQNLGISLQRS